VIGGTERLLEARRAVPANRQKSIGEAEALFLTNASQSLAKGDRAVQKPRPRLVVSIEAILARRRGCQEDRLWRQGLNSTGIKSRIATAGTKYLAISLSPSVE
jgi:hypothetical protein